MSSADQIIELYERHAQAYDAERGRSLFEKGWLDRFLQMLPPSGTVLDLDLGCGHGEPIAAYLVEKGCRLTGIDSSPSLIALCRARFPGHRWEVADMRRLKLNQRFDGILAWNSFFHLSVEDQRQMFAAFRQHAAPKAALMFTSGPHRGEAIGSYHGEPLYHASLAPEEYRALLAAEGYAVVAHKAEDPDCGGHTIWLAQLKP